MAEENLEIVRRMYDGWARGDFTNADAYHPDVQFEMPDWPEGASARGVEEMARTWYDALSAWDDFRAEPLEFLAAGPNVLVRNHIVARGRGSGMDVDAETASVWTLEEGKVVRLGLYWNVERAFEVAEIEP
jgi:ketosteroid isomerase-like protein